jgi:hypothetical protein
VGVNSDSISGSFTFNPTSTNVTSLLATGNAYFNVHTMVVGCVRGVPQTVAE